MFKYRAAFFRAVKSTTLISVQASTRSGTGLGAVGYGTLDFWMVHHEDQTPSESGGCGLSSRKEKISGGHQQVVHVKRRVLG